MYKIVIVAVLYLTGNGAEVEIARYTVEMVSTNRNTCTDDLATMGAQMERTVRGDLKETLASAFRLRQDDPFGDVTIRTNSYCRLR